jgi:hypothetical protein
MLYKCSSCGKENEVAFRVVSRSPEKISRATPDTPKPLCLLCAEKKRDRILAELLEAKNTKPKPSKSKALAKQKKAATVPGDFPLIWRWVAYGLAWTRRLPAKPGHYWVSNGVDQAPELTNIKDPVIVRPGNDVWYLGPIRTPPCPSEAEREKAKAPVKPKPEMKSPTREEPPPPAVNPAPIEASPRAGRMTDLEEQMLKRKTPFVKSFLEKAQEIIDAQEDEPQDE